MGKKPKIDRIRVHYKKLGKTKAFGWSHGQGFVEVDERLKGKKQLEIIIHECIHELLPRLGEVRVEEIGAILARTLWHEGYRMTDNNDEYFMQDECD